MRVVLDTNVLFAAFVTHGVCAGVYEECLLQADIVVSDFILRELAERLVTKGKFTEADAQEAVQAVRKDAHSVLPVALAHRICRDADDDWVLATALAGKAEAIVTGDKDLLVLRTYEGVAIVTPRGVLALMQGKH